MKRNMEDLRLRRKANTCIVFEIYETHFKVGGAARVSSWQVSRGEEHSSTPDESVRLLKQYWEPIVQEREIDQNVLKGSLMITFSHLE